MKKWWSLLTVICAIFNAVWIGFMWHDGQPANWFVWTMSIAFCIGTVIDRLEDII